MSATKLGDLAVKTGSYANRDGEQKNRYENIGALMQGDDGRYYILMKRTFNPAGVDVEPGRDMLLVGVFEERSEGDRQPPQRRQPAARPSPAGDDDIPF